MRKMTLYSVYKWFKSQTIDLFAGITLPDGVNRNSVFGNLLREAGEMGILYDDPDFFKEAIGFWSDEHKQSFEQIYAALTAEYGIIDNYNRIETITDTTVTAHSGNESGTKTSSGTTSNTSSDTGTISDITTKSTDTTTEASGTASIDATTSDSATVSDINYVSGYDGSNFTEKDKKESSSSSTITGDTDQTTSNNSETSISEEGSDQITRNLTNTTSGTTTASDSTSIEKEDETNTTYTRTAHLSGNIGVTTSQQMIEAELSLRVNNSFITIFKNMFIDEMLIQTY